MANGSLTKQGAKNVFDTFTTVLAYSLPPLFASLVKGTSNATTAGTETTTAEYTGYARQAFTGASWSGANSSGVSTYNAAINFGNNTAGSGATYTGIELWDDVSNATVTHRIWWAPFSGGNIVLPASAGQIQFASGAITATIPPLTSNTGFSQAQAQALCDHMTGRTTYTPSGAFWFFLATGHSTTTTIGTEYSDASYARIQASSPSTFFNAATLASPSVLSCASQVLWNAINATPGSNITDYGLATLVTAGNLLYGDTFTASYTPVAGQSPAINAGVTIAQLQ